MVIKSLYHLDLNKMFVLFFSEMLNKDVLEMIKGGYRISKPLDGPMECPEYFYNIIVDCWETNPENRPTFKSLHKMFKYYFTHDTDKSDDEDDHVG